MLSLLKYHYKHFLTYWVTILMHTVVLANSILISLNFIKIFALISAMSGCNQACHPLVMLSLLKYHYRHFPTYWVTILMHTVVLANSVLISLNFIKIFALISAMSWCNQACHPLVMLSLLKYHYRHFLTYWVTILMHTVVLANSVLISLNFIKIFAIKFCHVLVQWACLIRRVYSLANKSLTDHQYWLIFNQHFVWFSLAQLVRSRTMNLFNWLYWSFAFESDPELSVWKLHTLWGCEVLELGLRQM